MNDAERTRLRLSYPALAAMDPTLLDAVLAHDVQWVHVAAGTVLFDEGQPCRGFPLVVSGEVRVACGSSQGRALDLYRVPAGELCVVSTACVVGARPMRARGTASQACEIALLSAPGFERWCEAESFRRFVFEVFAERLADLMTLVEAVAFQRLDQRLAATLLGHGLVVYATHQDLADQLGTAREIVTRLLKRFEMAGHVRLARERIEVIDAAALRAVIAPSGESSSH